MRWLLLSFLIFGPRVFSGEPSDVALGLLRELDGKVARSELSKELAISPFCGPGKRKRIDELWESRNEWIQRGRYIFSPIEEKIDDNLAAVLIGATTPDGPDACMVLSLGLVKKDERWLLAPVDASFDNTGLGFGAEVKSRVRELERWMALQRVEAMAGLRRSEMERFRKEMEGAVSAAELAGAEPKEVLLNFIEAAENGKTNALIVWQGFLERDELPDRDWDQHLRVTRRGLQGKDKQRTWRDLSSRKVMKVIVEGTGDEEEAEFLVGFLSSYETEPLNERLNPVRFQLVKTGRGWRVRLPAYFAFADEESRVFRRAREDEFDWDDRSGVKHMFHVFENAHEQIHATDPGEVMKAVVEDLKTEGLKPFLRRHYREIEIVEEDAADDDEEADEDDDEEELLPQRNRRQGAGNDFDERRMGRYMMAVKWWGDNLKERDTLKAEVAKLYVEEKVALGILSLPTAGSSWKPLYRKVWMFQGEKGWVILPGVDLPMLNSYPAELQDVVMKVADRFSKDEVKMMDEFLVDVLKVVRLEDPKGSAASEEQAKKLVSDWRKEAVDGTTMNLLKISAVRKLPTKPTVFLKDLGFMRQGIAGASEPDQVLGAKAVGRFRGVSLETHGLAGIVFPLMIVVPTMDGHRVLIDIELPFEVNEGIIRLNEMRMDDLAEEMSEEDLAAIQELRKWHQGVSKPVFEKWEREQIEAKE